ncbi:hypothetical protein TB2_003227 [Malus domestica]
MKISKRGTTFIPTTKSKSGRKIVNFAHKSDGCLKLPDVVYGGPIGSRLVGIFSWDDGLQSPSGGIAIAFPIRWKIENGGWSTARTVDFRGLKLPHTVVNQGSS